MAQTRCLIARLPGDLHMQDALPGDRFEQPPGLLHGCAVAKLQKGRRHHDFANPIGRSRRERLCVGLAG